MRRSPRQNFDSLKNPTSPSYGCICVCIFSWLFNPNGQLGSVGLQKDKGKCYLQILDLELLAYELFSREKNGSHPYFCACVFVDTSHNEINAAELG